MFMLKKSAGIPIVVTHSRPVTIGVCLLPVEDASRIGFVVCAGIGNNFTLLRSALLNLVFLMSSGSEFHQKVQNQLKEIKKTSDLFKSNRKRLKRC